MDSSNQCNNNNIRSSSSYLCRQSSSRWIPTADQIRILRELYYNNGVRSPTAEQIQRISARLRQYGKIEGKNVFYWFQNHKARERQKKKLTLDNNNTTNSDSAITYNINDNNPSPGNGFGGSTVFLGRSIRESFSVLESSSSYNNMGWVGMEPTTMPWMYHYIKGEKESLTSAAAVATRTLPLFPTHQEEDHEEEEEQEADKYYCTTQPNVGYLPAAAYYCAAASQNQENYHHHYTATNGAAASSSSSLELTLNSYYCAPPGSM